MQTPPSPDQDPQLGEPQSPGRPDFRPPEIPRSEPLDYRNPTHDKAGRTWQVLSLLAGAAAGAVITVGSGCLQFEFHEGGATGNIIRAPFYGAAAILFTVLTIMAFRQPRRRWILIGFLLGLAVTALIEGVCFLGS